MSVSLSCIYLMVIFFLYWWFSVVEAARWPKKRDYGGSIEYL